jgi:predicted AAA+ superfamily ATPase
MKTIRFFTDPETVWYNLSDYIQLLLDAGVIRPYRPAPLYKRKIASKSIHDILFDKVSRLNPTYHRQRDGSVYVDWVVFEHLYRFIRPFLTNPDHWMNPESLFRQLQLAIERPKRSNQELRSEVIANYFSELTSMPLIDGPNDEIGL